MRNRRALCCLVDFNVTAVTYVELRLSDGFTPYGVRIDKNFVAAALKAAVVGLIGY